MSSSSSSSSFSRLTKAIIPSSFHRALGRLRLKFASGSTLRFRTWRYKDWPVLQCDIAYNKLGGYCVPISSRHRYAAQLVLRENVCEPNTIDFIVQNAKDGDVIQAGAFFGDFLPALSRGCAPLCKAWAFEPDPENYRCALTTILINDLRNVSLVNAGLGGASGIGKLVTHDESGKSLRELSHIQPESSLQASDTETVRIVTIDKTISSDRKISVLHLDVERYEEQVLTGALKTIRRSRPLVVLEDVPSEAWLTKHLKPLDYRIDRRIHHNTLLVPAAIV